MHIDTKKLGRIGCVGHRIHGDRRRPSPGVGWEFLHVCVDDATRVSYSEILSDERAEPLWGGCRHRTTLSPMDRTVRSRAGEMP